VRLDHQSGLKEVSNPPYFGFGHFYRFGSHISFSLRNENSIVVSNDLKTNLLFHLILLLLGLFLSDPGLGNLRIRLQLIENRHPHNQGAAEITEGTRTIKGVEAEVLGPETALFQKRTEDKNRIVAVREDFADRPEAAARIRG
ncbi:MAG: hypothetical protein H6Q43_2062, partial [Deltaproteobacteria bacterium]|nr:hypothetical protein [Deltaproteobacteria bacterium]